MSALLSLLAVDKTFATGVRAVERLTLEIPQSQFLAIVGPSGCGKSTLLRMIAGLDAPSSGTIDKPNAPIAYVFQDAHLLPWRTVLQNVALPLEFTGTAAAERLDRAAAVLKSVGLSDSMKQYPAQLSGGMRMRVSLARALVTSPALLLLDEPFAALDEITRQQLDDMLRQLWAEQKMTVVFVTHSIAEAIFLAERVLVLSRRPARTLLDHVVALPPQRDAALRGEPSFAAETRIVFQALHGGAVDGTAV